MFELNGEKLSRLWLQCAPMSAWNKISALKKRLGGAKGVWDHFTPALYGELGQEAFSFLAGQRSQKCQGILRQLDESGAYPVFYGESGYPSSLLPLDHPPDVLFVRGDLPPDNAPAIAIVGSRNATRYGLNQARRIAKGLSQKGVVIVSGLARGIDAAAHQGALDGGGKTVAILGCGVNRIYPPENKDLADRILSTGGAILSELCPDTQPLPYHFPVRNRIIAGLSHGLLLIEARQKSGTHSTVQYALNQGKEVFALPGNVDSPGSELPLLLLKEGANLCTGPEDILDRMQWVQASPKQESFFEECADHGDDPSYPILKALEMEEKTLEELIQETGMSPAELGTKLTLLEITGKIERRAGRAYALCR